MSSQHHSMLCQALLAAVPAAVLLPSCRNVLACIAFAGAALALFTLVWMAIGALCWVVGLLWRNRPGAQR